MVVARKPKSRFCESLERSCSASIRGKSREVHDAEVAAICVGQRVEVVEEGERVIGKFSSAARDTDVIVEIPERTGGLSGEWAVFAPGVAKKVPAPSLVSAGLVKRCWAARPIVMVVPLVESINVEMATGSIGFPLGVVPPLNVAPGAVSLPKVSYVGDIVAADAKRVKAKAPTTIE